ncbi:MAG TPA: hypothetical protein PKL77_08640 [Candidatus Omnitrophota bacterium]|nr:hypothetical protein [Candidatus Omnitrophota bacterium]
MKEKIYTPLAYSAPTPPFLRETGGMGDHDGAARLITAPDGGRKTAEVIYSHARPCMGHALIPVEVGDYLVGASYDDEDGFRVSVSKIIEFRDNRAVAETISAWTDAEGWDVIPPDMFSDAIDAAMKKAITHNCTEAMYVK